MESNDSGSAEAVDFPRFSGPSTPEDAARFAAMLVRKAAKQAVDAAHLTPAVTNALAVAHQIGDALPAEIVSDSLTPRIVRARHIAIWLVRRTSNATSATTGALFGTTQGSVSRIETDFEIKRSEDPELFAATEAAVQKWRASQ